MISVSKHSREVLKALLADSTVGFNSTLATICQDYKIDPFTLDFTSDNSKNFYQGFYGAKNLMETSNIRFPVMTMYTVKSQNQNLNKFLTFSGAIMIGIDVYLSWRKSSALPDTETLGDAVEATLYNVFNSEASFGFYGDLIYNGDLLVQKSPLAMDGQNWLQLIQSRLSVDLNG